MELTPEQLIYQITELEQKLEEYEQYIEAIKAGEIDGFALNKNNQPEVFTEVFERPFAFYSFPQIRQHLWD